MDSKQVAYFSAYRRFYVLFKVCNEKYTAYIYCVFRRVRFYVLYFSWPDNTITRIEFLHRIRNMEPNAQFRVLAQYSNVMYVAIGGILEAVSGKKWETIMNEEIFEPLKMKNTFCLMDDALRQGNCAIPYGWDNGLHALKRWNIDMNCLMVVQL